MSKPMEVEGDSDDERDVSSAKETRCPCIIVNNGSRYLRIGTSAALEPVQVPSFIARRVQDRDAEPLKHTERLAESNDVCDKRLQAIDAMVSDLHRQFAAVQHVPKAPAQVIGKHNCKVSEGEVLQAPEHTSTLLFGEEALSAMHDPRYIGYHPIRRGALNISSAHSQHVVRNDIGEFWKAVIEKHLEIPVSHFPHCDLVLVIPDCIRELDLSILVSVVLEDLKFKRIMIHQEPVMAAFGAGVSSACVIDVGDEKVSISCVEEGVSLRNGRFHMPMGRYDVDELVLRLFDLPDVVNRPPPGRSGRQHRHTYYWPFGDCDLDEYPQDRAVLDEFQALCHADPRVEDCAVFEFTRQRVNEEQIKYQMSIPPALQVLPTIALFYPDALAPLSFRDDKTRGELVAQEDLWHTLRGQHEKKELSSKDINVKRKEGDPEPEPTEEKKAEAVQQEKVTATIPIAKQRERLNLDISSTHRLALDDAIVESIKRAAVKKTQTEKGRVDMYRRLYSNILLCGGGSKWEGFAEMVTYKLRQKVEYASSDDVQVVPVVRATDASFLSYRGGCVLADLESTEELYLTLEEWEKDGFRVLWEKAPFRR